MSNSAPYHVRRLDLHVHSVASDGHLSPAEVVQAAAAGGLDVIAITDHDTAAGVAEARAAAADLPLEVIAGIEISAREQEHELHILGYGIDPMSEPIQRHQDRAGRMRQERMRGMVDRLGELGVPVEYEAVLAQAGEKGASIGRPHLARALLAAGHTRFYGEAFERYIADGGPAFVSQAFPSVAEAIEAIHAAGGVAVWAHPPADLIESLLPRFVGYGMDGVESFRPRLTLTESSFLEQQARSAGLFPTGGSDWHGPHRSQLGDFFVRPAQVPEIYESLLPSG